MEESAEKWSDIILKTNTNIRMEGISAIENSWYNIKNAADILFEYYANAQQILKEKVK